MLILRVGVHGFYPSTVTNPQPGGRSRVTPACILGPAMRSLPYMFRFLWNATRGHRLAPWRSPYLLWRIETYSGVKVQQIGFIVFWEFVWRERVHLWRFLKWTGEMDRYVHPKPNLL
jgi:hypothetical protein